MNIELTGDPLYLRLAQGFEESPPVGLIGKDGSRGEWNACADGFDFYIDDWHIARLNQLGDVFRSVPQSDRWRLEVFLGDLEDQ